MKLVILDRDGTLNEDREDYVKSPDEWVPLPGALEAVARLNQAGWHVVVATNQSGLGRGLFDMGALNAIHRKLNEALSRVGGRIDAFFLCPHAPEDHCHCRKPLPGLFEMIGERYGVDLTGVAAVGNSMREVHAAVTAGCRPHLVRSGRAAALEDGDIERMIVQVPDLVVHPHLGAFAQALIAAEPRRRSAASSL